METLLNRDPPSFISRYFSIFSAPQSARFSRSSRPKAMEGDQEAGDRRQDSQEPGLPLPRHIVTRRMSLFIIFRQQVSALPRDACRQY
jgi:hypothetical protein